MNQLLSKAIIDKNLLIFFYVIIINYIVTVTKTISLRSYIKFSLYCALIIIPLTAWLQYKWYFSFSSPYWSGIIVAAVVEEITKLLIPLSVLLFHKNNRIMSVTDFFLAAVSSGAMFSFIEDSIYNRSKLDSGNFHLFTGAMSVTYSGITYWYGHYIYPAMTVLLLAILFRYCKRWKSKLFMFGIGLLSLVYGMYEHGFGNSLHSYAMSDEVYYPDSKIAVFIHTLFAKGKYSDKIVYLMVFGVIIIEIYGALKQMDKYDELLTDRLKVRRDKILGFMNRILNSKVTAYIKSIRMKDVKKIKNIKTEQVKSIIGSIINSIIKKVKSIDVNKVKGRCLELINVVKEFKFNKDKINLKNNTLRWIRTIRYYETLRKLLLLSYFISLQNRPYVKHMYQLEIQKKNASKRLAKLTLTGEV